jgi:1,4-alpha-glucan branching enzyme
MTSGAKRTGRDDGPVTLFVYEPPGAAGQVELAGDFTGWAPMAMEMKNGRFEASTRLDPGEHQYRFIVDGQWVSDPAAAGEVPNPFGGMNSVVRV